MLKHGILGLLNYGDMTGYEIRETFENSLNYFWTAQTSQIYRELRTLECSGWISMQTVEQTGKPNKNLCSITDSGRQEFLRWLGEEPFGVGARSPLLMQVFFLGNRTREENIAWFHSLESQIRRYLQRLDPVEDIMNAYSRNFLAGDHPLYWEMTVDLGRRNLHTIAQWAGDCARRLEEAK